jgi:CubicO group peptidase (beta-lactamase class C family)
MRRSVLLLGSLLLSGCAVQQAAQVATTFSSQVLCDDVLVTGVDLHTAFAERVLAQPGMGLVAWGLTPEVDMERREVRVSVAGTVAARARHLDGLGCVALPADLPLPTGAPGRPATPVVAPTVADPRLAPVLADALASAGHHTKAVVVLQDGRLLAEAYAPGYGPGTPVLGFSMTKTVLNLLAGRLVELGRLRLDEPVLGSITVEQLLRQTSGLDLPQDNSGFDRSTQIMYGVADKAGAVAAATMAAAPGTRWAYSDTNFVLLARVLQQRSGQPLAEFAERELFAPLGVTSARFDHDAVGTPIGASHMLASARDWARFGQLLLDDGAAGGQRLLPKGWVVWSTTTTLDTGYGAGLWTNRQPGLVPGWGVPWGLSSAPQDAYFARGYMGQFVVVVPSERLVVVRLAVSPVRGDDIGETDRLILEVRKAVAPSVSVLQ